MLVGFKNNNNNNNNNNNKQISIVSKGRNFRGAGVRQRVSVQRKKRKHGKRGMFYDNIATAIADSRIRLASPGSSDRLVGGRASTNQDLRRHFRRLGNRKEVDDGGSGGGL